MRKIAVIFPTLMLFTLTCSAQKARTFHGEIMDSQCANMGSHDMMEKKAGTKNAADCTKKCIGMGGKYVLYDRSTQTAYELDDQEKAAPMAGERVTVTGTLDSSTKTIHVQSIEQGGRRSGSNRSE